MRVTRPNLLSWHNTAPDAPLPTFLPDCRTGALVTYAGDVSRFYLNLIAPVPIALATPSVQLIEARSSGTATAATAIIDIDSIEDGKSCLYGSVTCPAVPAGLYRWKLTWGSNVWTSGLIEVLSEADAKAVSIALVFSHPRSLHGVRYPWIEEPFSSAFRLRANLIDQQFTVNTASYREATTGIPRNYNTAADKLLKFQTTYLDRDLLEGIEFMLLHDSITLNGRSVVTRDHLSSTPGRSNLAPGQFSFIDTSFAYPLIP